MCLCVCVCVSAYLSMFVMCAHAHVYLYVATYVHDLAYFFKTLIVWLRDSSSAVYDQFIECEMTAWIPYLTSR